MQPSQRRLRRQGSGGWLVVGMLPRWKVTLRVVLGDRRAVLLDVRCLSSRQREQPAYGDSAVLLMRSCCAFVSPA